MNAAMTLPRPNTHDMVGVHQVFREAFGCASQLVGSVCNDRSDRVATVVAYYANVLALLRAHHDGEDALIWPKLVQRAPDHADLVKHMQAQHGALLEAVTESEGRLHEWAATPDIDRGASLAAALATLGVLCAAHFDEEERQILPLAADWCTVEEWAELPAHSMRSFTGDRMWLAIGLVQEQMPPQARAEMETRMPPAVRQMWQGEGRLLFTKFVADLRG